MLVETKDRKLLLALVLLIDWKAATRQNTANRVSVLLCFFLSQKNVLFALNPHPSTRVVDKHMQRGPRRRSAEAL